MPNYSCGKIYKIVCRITGLQYFGSTTEPTLAKRLAEHRNDFNKFKNESRRYMTSFEILKESNYYIELVELVPCSSRDELLVRERFHIQNNDCVNQCTPITTKEEKLILGKKWREEHKEELCVKHKIYYELKKDYINEKRKIIYKQNKEIILQNQKENYIKHRDKRLEKNKETFTCICGTISTICNKTRHEKTIKHQNYLKKELENSFETLEKNDSIENDSKDL